MFERVLGKTVAARRAGRHWTAAVLAGAAVAATLGLVPSPAAATEGETPASDVVMVQANIYTGLTTARFQADVREVLALEPDFVTYNEVSFRQDSVLAPDGYAIYRSMRNRYTSATPVAWRADRWEAIDQGTYRISNWRGVPPHRKTELGRRFANWVTLRDADGRVLSVVSIHVAPLVSGMPDLRRGSVERLGGLVATLSPRGPVLVGGDFNVHYKSGIYPRDLLDAHSLVPTYDTLGAYFPTGDHQGATIDYVFDRGVDQLTSDRQYPVELHSDHDAVVAGLSWQIDAPVETQVVRNDPSGAVAERRAIVTALTDGLAEAHRGETVQIATTGLDLRGLVRGVGQALTRGAHVRVAIGGTVPTRPERRVARLIAASGDAGSQFVRCGDTCRATWRAAGMPQGFMMVSNRKGEWQARFDSNRKLTRVLVDRFSKVQVFTGKFALADGEALLQSIP